MPTTQQKAAVIAETVNETILSLGIKHAVFLQRYKTGLVNETLTFLNDKVLPDLLLQLHKRLLKMEMKGFDTGPETTARLKDTIASVYELLRGGIREVGKNVQKNLGMLSEAELIWQDKILNRTTGAFGVEFVLPDVGTLKTLIAERPMQGRLMKEWWDKVSDEGQADIMKELQLGIAQGEGVDKMVRRIVGTPEFQNEDGAFGKLRRNVAATVRTSTSQVVNATREEAYKANEDLIDGWQFVATLDSRTTPQCQALDGQVFDVGTGPMPPLHWNCRSTTIPVIKSWKQLGISLKEAPEGTRASMDGQVPAKLTYGDWLAKQSTDIQNEILGPNRAIMFRKGEYDVTDFVDAQGKTLTLEELADK